MKCVKIDYKESFYLQKYTVNKNVLIKSKSVVHR